VVVSPCTGTILGSSCRHAFLNRVQYMPGEGVEYLIRTHYRQIVRLDLENLQRAVEHRAILTGINNCDFALFRPPEQPRITCASLIASGLVPSTLHADQCRLRQGH
jgi:hypothetical protein